MILRLEEDAEAGVWHAICDEIGLVTEADTLEDLLAKLVGMVPEMVAENKAKVASRQKPIGFLRRS